MSLPNPLYKYCNTWGIDILKNQRLKVTPFNQFNDPFELAHRMRSDFRLEDAQAMLRDRDFQRDLYAVTARRGQFSGSLDEFRDKILSLVGDDLARKLVEDYPRDAAEFRLSHMDNISREFGLVCLSEIPHEILMWSHYTNAHTGFVVGLDTTNAFFAQPPFHQVDYKEKRVLMGHFADLRDPPYRGEIIKSLIKTKASHWSYEREWRQLHILAQCLPHTNPTAQTKPIYYKMISPAVVSEVITGCRCDSRQIDEILSTEEFRHVKRRRARIHETDFKLVFEDV